MNNEVLAFREATELDLPFVVSSWVDSYRTAHAAGMIPMPLYERMMRECVAWVLSRPGMKIWVAYRPGEDPELKTDLYGWLAVESDVMTPVRVRKDGKWTEELVPAGLPLVHYCFTKQAYRRLGIARALLTAAGVPSGKPFLYACKTALVSQLPLPGGSRWTPLIARYPKRDALQ